MDSLAELPRILWQQFRIEGHKLLVALLARSCQNDCEISDSAFFNFVLDQLSFEVVMKSAWEVLRYSLNQSQHLMRCHQKSESQQERIKTKQDIAVLSTTCSLNIAH